MDDRAPLDELLRRGAELQPHSEARLSELDRALTRSARLTAARRSEESGKDNVSLTTF